MGVRVFHVPAWRAAHHLPVAPLLKSALVILLSLVAGCAEGIAEPSSGGVPVARVIIAPDSVALPRGQTMRLEALVVDASGNALDGREIRWSSSDVARVSVAQTGIIAASDVGSSLVSASSEGKADTVKVIVTQ
jgi:hypothetical protein